MSDPFPSLFTGTGPLNPVTFYHGQPSSSPSLIYSASYTNAFAVVTDIDITFGTGQTAGTGCNIGAFSSGYYFTGAIVTASFGNTVHWHGQINLYSGTGLYALYTCATAPYILASGYIAPALSPIPPT